MFKLYAGRRLPKIHLASSDDDFWKLVKTTSAPQSVFDDQGDEHGQIDGRLENRIEDLFVPIVGPWERGGVWFHNQDFFGNGIRYLSFQDKDFPPECIPQLQALLEGEAAAFCIHVQLYDTLSTAWRQLSLRAERQLS